jgi:uncharacterized protein
VTILGLKLDVRLTVVVLASTMLLLFDEYHRVLPSDAFGSGARSSALERTVLYLVIPAAIVVFGFRDRLSDYGLRLGEWRPGLRWTLGSLAVLAPILFVVAQTSEVQEYYAQADRSTLDVVLVSGLNLLGWEFLFRGFLIFGLYRTLGPAAVLLQAVPFAMAHIGKPEIETMTTVIGGAGFGWVAWRTKSFLYPFLIHWGLNVFVRLVAAGTV